MFDTMQEKYVEVEEEASAKANTSKKRHKVCFCDPFG
jgi:hypothetical protein